MEMMCALNLLFHIHGEFDEYFGPRNVNGKIFRLCLQITSIVTGLRFILVLIYYFTASLIIMVMVNQPFIFRANHLSLTAQYYLR